MNRHLRPTKMLRLPAVAGSFYPASPETLSAQVQGFIDQAPSLRTETSSQPYELIGLIVPHAGYTYSGHVAGYAYRQLRNQSFDTVILIGLSHRYNFQGVAIYPHGAFRTPLGDISINQDITEQLVKNSEFVAHLPQAHEFEHSLEVQLPFLQKSLTSFSIVPLLMRDDSPKLIDALSPAIAQAIEGRNALLVGSTDLCHYPTYDEAVKSDQVVIEAIQHLDTDYLRDEMTQYMETHTSVSELHCMMCSTAAIYTTLETAKSFGANQLKVLKAANSGDVPAGQRNQVVGYMAGAIYRK